MPAQQVSAQRCAAHCDVSYFSLSRLRAIGVSRSARLSDRDRIPSKPQSSALPAAKQPQYDNPDCTTRRRGWRPLPREPAGRVGSSVMSTMSRCLLARLRRWRGTGEPVVVLTAFRPSGTRRRSSADCILKSKPRATSNAGYAVRRKRTIRHRPTSRRDRRARALSNARVA